MRGIQGSEPKTSSSLRSADKGVSRILPPIFDQGDNPFTRFLEVIFAKQLPGWLILLTAVLIVGSFLEVPKLILPIFGEDGWQKVALPIQIVNYIGWVLMWNRWVLYGAKRTLGSDEYINHRNIVGVVVALVAALVFWQINTFFPDIPSIPLPLLLVFLGLQIFPFVMPNPDENGPAKLQAAVEIFLVVRAILFVLIG